MFMTAVSAAATKPHALSLTGTALQIADAIRARHGCYAEAARIGATLARLVRDGNVRAMEALASVIVRSDRGQISAAAALPNPATVMSAPADQAALSAGTRIARRALAGTLPDHSRGANLFHRVGDFPDWAKESRPVAEVGEFLFYRSRATGVTSLVVSACSV